MQRKKGMCRPSVTLWVAMIAGCSGTGSKAVQHPTDALDVLPRNAQVVPGGVVEFTALADGVIAHSLRWEVIEASGGTIETSGRYTAPTHPGRYGVRASTADGKAQGTAVVDVNPAPSVTIDISPTSASVPSDGTLSFFAVVSGATNVGVNWTVQEASGCGTVTTSGTYRAPATVATCHVVATAAADPEKTAVATVTVMAAQAVAPTLQVDGRHLLDTCGNRLVIRGVEQPMGHGFGAPAEGPGRSLMNTVDQIAATGANAVRFLPNLAENQPYADINELDALFARAVGHKMVIFFSPYASGASEGQARIDFLRATWARADIKALVDKYSKWIIVDAYQEAHFNDRARWRAEALDWIAYIRDLGYTQPITVISNQYGRDLPALFTYGAELVAADPLKKVILGWQAYWGVDASGFNYYGDKFGNQLVGHPITIADGVAMAAAQPFPIQVGFDYKTDPGTPGQIADFAPGMTAAGADDVGWLWWAYYHPYEWTTWRNQLTNNGTNSAANLEQPYGPVVLSTHQYSLQTAVKACSE